LNLIEQNNKISRKQLSDILNINPSAIQKHINKLKQKGLLKRVGSAKGGYWEIIE
ncbi:winged helix-turn-helix transcriptional regulator, partial [bacterium]|nr:winged helix-turn-helix transcriptional regulator [bacterium]